MGELVKRSTKKAFYGVQSTEGIVYTRMRYFTELSTSKNPVEYSRQYVDQSMETTDVVGYSPSMSFAFDSYTDDAVLEDIVSIVDKEKLGTDAQREIILVDFSKESGGGYAAIKRTFAVIADSEGDGSESYSYSGTFKVSGTAEHGIATIATPTDGDSENVETITFVADTDSE